MLLLCQPTQSFQSIRQELLQSLQATGIEKIEGDAFSKDAEDIILGVPLDKSNMDKGWVNLEIPEFEEGDAKPKGAVKKGSVLNKTPLGAGLKDGDMLAFRFKRESSDEMDLDEDWNVTLPSLEDDTEGQSQS